MRIVTKKLSRNIGPVIGGEAGFSMVAVLLAIGISILGVLLFNQSHSSFNSASIQDKRRQGATSFLALVKKELDRSIGHQVPNSWDGLKRESNSQTFTLISPLDYLKHYNVRISTVCRKINEDLGRYARQRVESGLKVADESRSCIASIKCKKGEVPSVAITYEGNHGFTDKGRSFRRATYPGNSSNHNKDPLAMAVCYKWNGNVLDTTIEIEWITVRDKKKGTYQTKAKSARLVRKRPTSKVQLVP